MDKVAEPSSFLSAPKTDYVRTLIEAFKFLGIFRCAATYPAMDLALKVFRIILPSFEAKRAANYEFAKAKVEKRLDLKTDRKDFMTYVSFRPDCLPGQPPDICNR